MLWRRDLAEVDGHSADHAANGDSGEHSSSQKHADVDAASLDRSSDSDDDTHQLHETNAAKLVANGSLDQGANCLACAGCQRVKGTSVAEHNAPAMYTATTLPVTPLDGLPMYSTQLS